MGAGISRKMGSYLKKRRIARLKRAINDLIKRRHSILQQLRREGYYITSPDGGRRLNPLADELKALWRVSEAFSKSLCLEMEDVNDPKQS